MYVVSRISSARQRMFSVLWSDPSLYNEDTARTYSSIVASHVEAGSNTSTVALRVVGGDENGSLEPETVKYGHDSHWTQTRK
jgi:hypothetical protein